MSHDTPETPSILLRSLEEIRANPELLQPPTVVVPRLAWTGRVTMLAGREKDGKSTLAAAGCASLSRGGYFLGDFTPCGNVLWLSSDAESLFDQVARFMRFNAEPKNVWLCTEWDRTPASFVRAIQDNRPSVAVVDTLAAFAELAIQDANASAAWTPVMTALKRTANETGAAIILVHHASKSTGRYRDSTAIGAGVDAILELEPSEDGAATRRIRARAKWHMENFSVRLVGDGFELEDIAALAPEARILIYIEEHPGCSKVAVRDAVGGRARDTDSWLDILERRGAIEDRVLSGRHAYHRRPGYAEIGVGRDRSGQARDNPRDNPQDDLGSDPLSDCGTRADRSGQPPGQPEPDPSPAGAPIRGPAGRGLPDEAGVAAGDGA